MTDVASGSGLPDGNVHVTSEWERLWGINFRKV